MYKLSFLVALLSLAAHSSADIDAQITNFAQQVNTDGSYAFEVIQSNGAEFREIGIGAQYANGEFKYVSPGGEDVHVQYRADEEGFHPISDWLPTPPPIPDYILRSIEYIKNNPTPEELADQQVRATQL